ncbi:MAG: bifunctional (p)ppGpp synthetase/guanosine-3',5'-bis(diphosphate) 3'-pyrophosphohydrolase [bacterium]
MTDPLVEKAYEFAKLKHEGDKRLSGEPYITHPMAVAKILEDLEQDPKTIAAAYLHDLVEDANVTIEEIKKMFGEDVAKLVAGVTKLSHLTFVSREARQAENFRKMFVAMGEDYRIIVIKLADRLHNMQTLQFLPTDKQLEIALETREIFAPLAHRMGMWRLKWQLEDLSFMYLEPAAYEEIKKKVAESREGRETFIKDFLAQVRELLDNYNIKAEVNGRAKHFYSIYQKMLSQRLGFEDIFDLTAVRIITGTVKDCYNVLGFIHDSWKPIPGKFTDYIAMPKSNGYQSLHTTVFGADGRPVEIQIRTREMHRTAEYGVAAHWRYKEGGTDKTLDQKMSWLRQMLEWQNELKDATDFMESLKTDLIMDEVFVFSPKGDVYGFPPGATPLDFAYRVHTEIGHRCVGAKVGGAIVPLDYKLKNGDIIEIITGKKDNPSLDWLLLVKTAGARVKIKNWVKKHKGEVKAETVPIIIKETIVKPLPVPQRKGKSKMPIKVAGLENILIKISKCCFPIPGEPIIGYVTQGRGVAIHRTTCKNVIGKKANSEKLIKVEWNENIKQLFPVEVEVEAFDRVGLIKDILAQIAETGTNVAAAKATTKRGSSAILRILVDVYDAAHLARVTAAILKVSDVYNVRRK